MRLPRAADVDDLSSTTASGPMRRADQKGLQGAPARAACAALVLACGVTVAGQNPRNLHNVGPERFTSRVVASGLSNPWEVVWGPDDHLWVTERTGVRVTRINPVDLSRRVALQMDDVYQSVVQDGLLGMALHPDPTACRELKFSPLTLPASVPRARESEWNHPDFVEPLVTLWTVPEGYDLAKFGSATIAPAGIAVYGSPSIPGWATSILVTGMRTGAVYRLKLATNGREVEGTAVEYFKADDRYRDVTLGPDGRRIFLVTDSFGATAGADGQRTDVLSHPGSLLEFTYEGPRAGPGR